MELVPSPNFKIFKTNYQINLINITTSLINKKNFMKKNSVHEANYKAKEMTINEKVSKRDQIVFAVFLYKRLEQVSYEYEANSESIFSSGLYEETIHYSETKEFKTLDEIFQYYQNDHRIFVEKVLENIIPCLDLLFKNNIKLLYLTYDHIIMNDYEDFFRLYDLKSLIEQIVFPNHPKDFLDKVALPDISELINETNFFKYKEQYLSIKKRSDKISLCIMLVRLISGNNYIFNNEEDLRMYLRKLIADEILLKMLEDLIDFNEDYKTIEEDEIKEIISHITSVSIKISSSILKKLAKANFDLEKYHNNIYIDKLGYLNRIYVIAVPSNLKQNFQDIIKLAKVSQTEKICALIKSCIINNEKNQIYIVEQYIDDTLEQIKRNKLLIEIYQISKFVKFSQDVLEFFKKYKTYLPLDIGNVIYASKTKSFFLFNTIKLLIKDDCLDQIDSIAYENLIQKMTLETLSRILNFLVLQLMQIETSQDIEKKQSLVLSLILSQNDKVVPCEVKDLCKYFYEAYNSKMNLQPFEQIFLRDDIIQFITKPKNIMNRMLVRSQNPSFQSTPLNLASPKKDEKLKPKFFISQNSGVKSVTSNYSFDPSLIQSMGSYISVVAQDVAYICITTNKAIISDIMSKYNEKALGFESKSEELYIVILDNLDNGTKIEEEIPSLAINENNQDSLIECRKLILILKTLIFINENQAISFPEGNIDKLTYDNKMLLIRMNKASENSYELINYLKKYAIKDIKMLNDFPSDQCSNLIHIINENKLNPQKINLFRNILMLWVSIRLRGYTCLKEEKNNILIAKDSNEEYVKIIYFEEKDKLLNNITEKFNTINTYLKENLDNNYLECKDIFTLQLSTDQIMFIFIQKFYKIQNESNINSNIIEATENDKMVLFETLSKFIDQKVILPDLKEKNFIKIDDFYKFSLCWDENCLQNIELYHEKLLNRIQLKSNNTKETIQYFVNNLLQKEFGNKYKSNLHSSLIKYYDSISRITRIFIINSFNSDHKLDVLGIYSQWIIGENSAIWDSFPNHYHYRTLLYFLEKSYDKLAQLIKLISGSSSHFSKLIRIEKITYLVIFNAKNGGIIYFGGFDENMKYYGCGRQYLKSEIYIGQFKDGQRNGFGDLYDLKTNDHYNGEFINNQIHGKGTSYRNNGKMTLIGFWVHGELEGDGTAIEDGGMIYIGAFIKSKYHGQGKLVYVDGVVYMQGEFYEGKKNGLFKINDMNGNFLTNQYYQNDVATASPRITLNSKNNFTIDIHNSPDERSTIKLYPIKQCDDEIYQDDRDGLCYDSELTSKSITNVIRYLNEEHNEEFYDETKSLEFFLENKFKRILYFDDSVFFRLTQGTLAAEDFDYALNIIDETKPYHGNGFLIFDIFDRILFVIKDLVSQFYLLEINTENKEKYKFIKYCSSSIPIDNNKNENDLALLKHYVEAEIMNKCIDSEDVTNYLKKIENISLNIYNVNHQQNTIDSGVFVCGCLKSITDNQSKITFDNNSNIEIRIWLADLHKDFKYNGNEISNEKPQDSVQNSNFFQ